ncbi:MAG: hypothetical protein HC911_13740 [Chloroflexaceae bacterium]|nr:hypothetical protein [Chloroflexaceae bacterium]
MITRDYLVVLWSSDDLLSDVLCYAVRRLQHPCVRVDFSTGIPASLLASDATLILVMLPNASLSDVCVVCEQLRQTHVVVPILLGDPHAPRTATELPPDTHIHPYPPELAAFHALLQQVVQAKRQAGDAPEL